MNWLKTVMGTGAVCGVLAGEVTGLTFAAEDGHVKEVIKHAKEGIAHEKETIQHLEEAIKGSENVHAKEAPEHAKASLRHAEELLAHAEEAHQPAKKKYARPPSRLKKRGVFVWTDASLPASWREG